MAARARQKPAIRPDPIQDRALQHQAEETRRERIIAVYAKIYGIAKLVMAVLAAYGAEIDESPSGIKFHIEQVESQMTEDSTSKLLETVEDLFYALYGGLNVEIANVQMCQNFQPDFQRNDRALMRYSGYPTAAAAAASGRQDCLPGPTHISMIFHACKRLLKSEEIYGQLDRELIHKYKAEYVEHAVEEYAADNSQGDHHRQDLLAYRRYIEKMISGPNSPYGGQWTGLNPIYRDAPGMVPALLLEKYLAFQTNDNEINEETYPQQHEYTEAAAATLAMRRSHSSTSLDSQLTTSSAATSFTTTSSSTNPHLSPRRCIEANREAAYAMLSGISVGEHRRLEGKRALRQYVRDQLCICFGYCSCAHKCTLKNVRVCPCSARMSVICDVEIAGGHNNGRQREKEVKESVVVVRDYRRREFESRAGRLARALFEGLCNGCGSGGGYGYGYDRYGNGDGNGNGGGGMSFFEVYMEIKAGAEVFRQEVVGYRRAMGL
ncbi:hypothetical protein AJ79_01259 [Helicocarpus griseus UAMH5409]|uniref:Uncharacterized protein n=1 Tax=Helicocarpus griseus UAMH5409 TaxID=1447875 RepID=A0A2B7Y7T8_9EURO|nr:hypothetical protein AJ79_01259 [Helicocarpus griseus UAMH5409]